MSSLRNTSAQVQAPGLLQVRENRAPGDRQCALKSLCPPTLRMLATPHGGHGHALTRVTEVALSLGKGSSSSIR